MLKEVMAEILELSSDLKFLRNLSCVFILAIACLFTLSDLRSNSIQVSTQLRSTSSFHLNTRSFTDRK
ncbi:hypothetical protein I4641_19545 [Waterburya agarophytonicola K14]|uniref:Uncharacterized protein n=1 Tax=Waterburya agarophytonicola KI4 TaxID=2874699 RepID=A0A964BT37_9CYAN|nr:hypothetical protein [Waterburya agarophytonicola]MCC0179163.1 hypothetical protein [Waterburya agarophytonicola KI4]